MLAAERLDQLRQHRELGYVEEVRDRIMVCELEQKALRARKEIKYVMLKHY